MIASGDVRFVPVLLELRQTPVWLPLVAQRLDQSLLDLTGGTGERSISDWIRWVGSSPEIIGPPGFDIWKGELLADNVDERMADFFVGEIKKSIRIEEIVWGGVPRDGIPDLENPPIIGADEADYLGPNDRVFGLSINGEHRAYPHRILNWHEMVNDTLGGEPIALAY
jgi:hypothetical protein